MTTEERIKLVNEVKEMVRSNDGNLVTLMFLIAVMTDSELVNFHKNHVKNKEV